MNPPQTFRGEIFEDKMVDLESNVYFNCRFLRCHLNYSGGVPSFDTCFFESCRVRYTGTAALAVEQLRAFWSIPGGGPRMVEELITFITGVPDPVDRLLR